MIYRGNGVPVLKRIEFATRKSTGSSGCWAWLGRKSVRGYGIISHQRKTWRVPRLVWTLRFGPIPAGKLICHTCDHPWCVRPSHLFLGTAIENNADKQAKNRQAKGERCNHKLTAEQVLQLRAMYQPRKMPMRILAQRFDISPTMVHLILTRKFWSHLPQASTDILPRSVQTT